MILPNGRIKLTHPWPEVRLIDCAGPQLAANWIDAGSTGTPGFADDPSYGIDSANALRFTQSNAGGTFQVTKRIYNAAGWDCSKSDIWTMALEYAPGVIPGRFLTGTTVNITLTISSNGDGVFTDNHVVTLLNASTTGLQQLGRNVFSWRTSDMTPGGAGTNMRNVTNVRIRVNTTSSTDSFALQGLWNGRRGVPFVCFTFDDGDATQGMDAGEATKIANDAGIPTTLYIIPDLIDNAGALSTADLTAAYAAGNSVAVHGVGGLGGGLGNLTDYSDSGLAHVTACRDWIAARGWDSEHYSYPGGARNGTVVQILRDLGFKTGRALRGQSYVAGPPTIWPNRVSYEGVSPSIAGMPDWFSINACPLSNVLTLTALKAALDLAIQKGEGIVFYGHKLGAVADNLTIVTSDYQALIDYAALKERQGLLDSLTIPRLYDSLNVRRSLAGPRVGRAA